jgi:hypothetical protein
VDGRDALIPGGLVTGGVPYRSGPTKAKGRRSGAPDFRRVHWSPMRAGFPRRRSPESRPAPRDEAPHGGSEPRGKAACWRPWVGESRTPDGEAASRRPFPDAPLARGASSLGAGRPRRPDGTFPSETQRDLTDPCATAPVTIDVITFSFIPVCPGGGVPRAEVRGTGNPTCAVGQVRAGRGLPRVSGCSRWRRWGGRDGVVQGHEGGGLPQTPGRAPTTLPDAPHAALTPPSREHPDTRRSPRPARTCPTAQVGFPVPRTSARGTPPPSGAHWNEAERDYINNPPPPTPRVFYFGLDRRPSSERTSSG